jgi:hypothetical protein
VNLPAEAGSHRNVTRPPESSSGGFRLQAEEQKSDIANQTSQIESQIANRQSQMIPDLFRLIGSDRYLSPEEVSRASEPHALMASAWDVYMTHFHGFTGATIDPQFHRLSHPATRTGRVRLGADTTVLVAGSGPSLVSAMHGVRRVRDRVRIFTSPRGAALLAGYGVEPDLVLVDPLSGRSPKGCPLVAADWRTPRDLLAGVATESLFVPTPLPTWGVWPATAVAMAADAGASRIALVGFDHPDGSASTAGEALTALLELLARLAPFTAFDCNGTSAPARGWVRASVHEIAGTPVAGALETNVWRAPSPDQRELQLRDDLSELAPVLERVRELGACAALSEAAIGEVIGWREQPRLRVLLQESLGVSLLPRLWRLGPDQAFGRSRRVRLALSEITRQADALEPAA